jgi:hypothetical protein
VEGLGSGVRTITDIITSQFRLRSKSRLQGDAGNDREVAIKAKQRGNCSYGK